MSELVLVLRLIGMRLLSESRRLVDEKPTTSRHSNENRSIKEQSNNEIENMRILE